ncbi:hypothetical protein JRQ81_001372 [Phrynocephalus forsythii]|uniref:Uncharacterized protein n=1 Tax=Phrynocephalus forsythii TaxID=171643 RepID=A0A9Q1B8C0_9SAUR|nr:hypothetical protein JRQ81_001372 [Phrynocephalus forsythii]
MKVSYLSKKACRDNQRCLILLNVEMGMSNQEKTVIVASKRIVMQSAVRNAHFPMELTAVMAHVVMKLVL